MAIVAARRVYVRVCKKGVRHTWRKGKLTFISMMCGGGQEHHKQHAIP